MSHFLFVIDTDSYAGNFERQMCAFVTGRVGECEVGDDEAAIAERELPEKARNWFDMNVQDIPDDKGCYRPALIYSNPAYWNNGMGKHRRWDEERPAKGKAYPAYMSVGIALSKPPTKAVAKIMKARAKRFAQRRRIEIEGFRLVTITTTETVSEI